MKLYQSWKQLTEMPTTQEQYKRFWKEYFDLEKEFYKDLLSKEDIRIKGKISDLAKQRGVEPQLYYGFLDGINDSLEEKLELESLTEKTEIDNAVNLKELFLNMLRAKAKWLYELKQWDTLLTDEEKREIKKKFQSENTVRNSQSVGRNDPCPCGSGRKYKKCCGK